MNATKVRANEFLYRTTNSRTAITQRTQNTWVFSTPDLAVDYDTTLCKTAKDLYHILVSEARGSRQVCRTIPYLAECLGRSDYTVQRRLGDLIRRGVVIREFVRTPTKRKYKTKDGQQKEHYVNKASTFIIVGRFAPCYQGTEYGQPMPDDFFAKAKMRPGWSQKVDPNILEVIEESESKETNLKGEAKLPTGLVGNSHATEAEPKAALKVHEGQKAQTPSSKAEELDFTGVPSILKPTTRQILTLSGRTKLDDYEIQCLRELLDRHTPARIQREVEDRAEYFRKTGRNMKCLRANYIHKILIGQQSFYPDKKGSKRNKKAAKNVHSEQSEVIQGTTTENETVNVAETIELTIPVAEAEKVIAEYEAGQPAEKEVAPEIPAALEKLYTKMRAESERLTDEYFDSLPVDDNGDYVLPDEGDLPGDLTMEDYLHLKFPEAEEEELHTDYDGNVCSDYSEHAETNRLQRAFEIDCACAYCTGPESCQLPDGCKKGDPKVEAQLLTDKDGKRFLGTGFIGCIKCRHADPNSREKAMEEQRKRADFERKLSQSGLVQYQAVQTFETYQHGPGSPELIAAKAQAILASKNKTNLILAGRAGTGKTHLAIDIAIEAMKQGRQAIFRTVPELIDELRRANQEHTDPYGLMMKFKSVPCLVLDDWGQEKSTEAAMDYLYQIINYRYTNSLQTIVTTNKMTPDGLKKPWTEDKIEPLVSRLLENGKWVTISCAENRRMKRAPEQKAADVLDVAMSVGCTMPNYEHDDGLDDDEEDLRVGDEAWR